MYLRCNSIFNKVLQKVFVMMSQNIFYHSQNVDGWIWKVLEPMGSPVDWKEKNRLYQYFSMSFPQFVKHTRYNTCDNWCAWEFFYHGWGSKYLRQWHSTPPWYIFLTEIALTIFSVGNINWICSFFSLFFCTSIGFHNKDMDRYTICINRDNKSYSPMKVVKISKHTRWLFWNSFTNGKARTGRYWVSPKIGDQWARADKILNIKSHNQTECNILHSKW